LGTIQSATRNPYGPSRTDKSRSGYSKSLWAILGEEMTVHTVCGSFRRGDDVVLKDDPNTELTISEFKNINGVPYAVCTSFTRAGFELITIRVFKLKKAG
jgi:hypothetical protein